MCQTKINFALENTEMIMTNQNQCRVTYVIVDFVHKYLLTWLGLESKQAIMGNVLANSTLTPIMHDGFLLQKVARVGSWHAYFIDGNKAIHFYC